MIDIRFCREGRQRKTSRLNEISKLAKAELRNFSADPFPRRPGPRGRKSAGDKANPTINEQRRVYTDESERIRETRWNACHNNFAKKAQQNGSTLVISFRRICCHSHITAYKATAFFSRDSMGYPAVYTENKVTDRDRDRTNIFQATHHPGMYSTNIV